MTTSDLQQLRRRVHLVLAVAILASVAANVLAAEPTWPARLVAAWPPVALMLVVDVLGRAPTADGWAGRAAVVAAGLVALVAALASFSHVRSVALMVGESELVAWVLPLSVDGLAVVCSVALVEINRRANALPLEQISDSLLEQESVSRQDPAPTRPPRATAPAVAPVVSPVSLPVPLSPLPAVVRPVSV